MKENIDLSAWNNYFNDFTRRNQSRPTSLEVFGEPGVQKAERGLPFAGISLDTNRSAPPSVEIMFGGHDAMDPHHLTHVIADVQKITPKRGLDGRDATLEIISGGGYRNLLCFEPCASMAVLHIVNLLGNC